MNRRLFLQYSAALASLSAMPSAWADNKTPFTIYGAPALPSMVIAVAALQGQLAKQTDVALKIWRSPDQLRAGVASGMFKVMMSPSNVGVNLRNQGQKVGMVNILTNGVMQLMSKQKAMMQPQDLINKKVLIPFKNDMPDIVLQALLKQLGIGFQKISPTYTATPVEAVGLFLSKDYDAVLLPEPMATASVLRGKTLGVNVVRGFDIAKTWGEAFDTKPMIPQAGMIADVAFYQANKAYFEQFHQDLKQALHWVNHNRQSAANIARNYLPAPVPALVQSIPHAHLTVLKGSEVKSELMRFYEILLRFNPKLLGGKLPDDAFFLM